MIAAVSDVLSRSRSSQTPRRQGGASKPPQTGWAFQRVPNLNRETRQAIGKAKAGWTFTTICTELGYACHKGKASWGEQRLGIGLRALARESGQEVRKVRRDCAALEKLGLVVVSRPKVLHVADPATGQIVTKARGRCQAALVYLTITEAALRPPKGQHGTEGGTTVAPPRAASKGHSGTTVRDIQNQRTPDGDAAGIGTPPAGPGGRLAAAEAPGLPAGEAGGHSAAKASQEGSIMPVDAGRDEPPLPAGRIVPAAPRRAAPARGRERHPEDSRPWDQASLDAVERTRRRLEAEAERRRQEDAAWAAMNAESGQPQAKAPTPPPAPEPPPAEPPAASANEVRMILDAIERRRARGEAGKVVA
jgi:hypothetical protein